MELPFAFNKICLMPAILRPFITALRMLSTSISAAAVKCYHLDGMARQALRRAILVTFVAKLFHSTVLISVLAAATAMETARKRKDTERDTIYFISKKSEPNKKNTFLVNVRYIMRFEIL